MRLPACAVLLIAGIAMVAGCSESGTEWRTMTVTASAYTIAADETDDEQPGLAAWGDVLKPGMHAIAVSRDLIKKGLGYGAKVRIEGLPGVYTVRDKMDRRWQQKIDILMKTKKKVREWGKQQVTIHWRPAGKAGR